MKKREFILVLILSKDPTGNVLSWQMSAERASPCEGGYSYTATIKSYGGNTEKVAFFLRGATKKDLKKVHKWRINSAETAGQVLSLTLTPVGKKEAVDILQMVGRVGQGMNETIISFLSPSDVHAGNNNERRGRFPKLGLPEAVLG